MLESGSTLVSVTWPSVRSGASTGATHCAAYCSAVPLALPRWPRASGQHLPRSAPAARPAGAGTVPMSAALTAMSFAGARFTATASTSRAIAVNGRKAPGSPAWALVRAMATGSATTAKARRGVRAGAPASASASAAIAGRSLTSGQSSTGYNCSSSRDQVRDPSADGTSACHSWPAQHSNRRDCGQCRDGGGLAGRRQHRRSRRDGSCAGRE
jgi:hypothetical protein